MGIELGHRTRAAHKKHTGAWGDPAQVLGANDGFELINDSIKPKTNFHPNTGLFASAFQRPGSAGNYLVGPGDVTLEMYYQCFGHRFLAQVFADAVTALGGGAHRHDWTLRNTSPGIHGVIVIPGDEGVREINTGKVTGIKLRWDESSSRGQLMVTVVGHDYNINVGSPDDAFVSVSAAVATGPRTITAAAQAQFTPSPVTMTKDAGVTAINVTMKAEDRWGNQYEKTFTEANFVSNVFTDTAYVRRIISVNINSFTGSANARLGVTNGVNNATTITAITMEASRDISTFHQLEFLINYQSGAALAAADEQWLSSLEIGVDLSADQRVTGRFKNRADEPSTGGGGNHAKVTCSFGLSAHTDRNRIRLYDAIQMGRLKAKATLSGPQIASSGTAHKIEIWLNNLQLPETDPPVVGGAGVQPVTFTGEAHQADAVPTGFPAGADEAMFLQVTNGFATAIT